MRIRKLTTRDRAQYRELCRYCFGMTAPRAAAYVAEKKSYDQAFGAFDGTKLAAGLWYYPYEMRVGGPYLPMAGVSTVATWPEYRYHGLAKDLMVTAQEYMKKTGCFTSVLLPFKYSFYERMGYARTFDVLTCEFEPGQIRRFPTEGYRVAEVDGVRHWRDLERVRLRYGERYNGTVRRDLAYWKRNWFTIPKRVIRPYLVYRGKTACGFVLTAVDEPYDYPKAKMLVFGLAWTEPGAARAIFTFFGNHSDQFKNIKTYIPPDVDILQYFDDPRIEAKLQPKMMFKLVDVVPAIEKRSYPGQFTGEVGLDLQGDETAPWNSGKYLLSFDSGKARLKVKQGRGSAKSRVKISIQALSQLYLGYYSVDELRQMNAIGGSDAALAVLDAAFPKTPTYIEDWF